MKSIILNGLEASKRTHEKALWNYSMKLLTYLPIFNKNQKEIKQILIEPRGTSKYCSKCGNEVIFITSNEVYCKNRNRHKNKHLNSADNISKRTIEILKKILKNNEATT